MFDAVNADLTQDDIKSAANDCRTLKQCCGVLTLAALIYSLATVTWTASIVPASGGTCFLRLPAAPLWRPPETPDFADFVKSLPSLQGQPPPKEAPTLWPNLGASFLKFALWLWAVCVLAGIIYTPLAQRSRDITLDVIWWTAVSMTIAAALCLLPWLILGGWGPAGAPLFALLGLVAGPIIAISRQGWSGHAARILAEKRQHTGGKERLCVQRNNITDTVNAGRPAGEQDIGTVR